MIKGELKLPTYLLLTLFVLVIGLAFTIKISNSTDTGTYKKVQEKHQAEKELYEITP